jgi:hypothetical protein
MGKIFNGRTYIIIIAILVCILVALSLRSCFQKRKILATIVVTQTEKGALVQYSDSTKSAKQWRWNFGNGNPKDSTRAGREGAFSTIRTGKFFYPADTVVQRYEIRLIVDSKLEKRFLVNVHAKQGSNANNQIVSIVAPDQGMQGEYIAFIGQGNSKEWRWSFGESGMVDAREKTAIYRYENPGTYTVQLETEETKYPVLHTIIIEPQYSDNDTTDVASQVGSDIKARLQAIVNQQAFDEKYSYILNKHLCGRSNTLVVVNNTKKNDFYSYCQGLRIIGRKRTIIDNVIVDMDVKKDGSYCVTKITVLQTDL